MLPNPKSFGSVVKEINQEKCSPGVTTLCLEQKNWLKHMPLQRIYATCSLLNYQAPHILQSLYAITVAISCKMLKTSFEVLHLQVWGHCVLN